MVAVKNRGEFGMTVQLLGANFLSTRALLVKGLKAFEVRAKNILFSIFGERKKNFLSALNKGKLEQKLTHYKVERNSINKSNSQ